MKKSIQIIGTALVMLFGNSAFSQNDTMYVMKNGVIIIEQSVNPSDVDSIIFYRPTTTPSITDADGNVYTSVTIGSQEWMVENLRTTTYSDGTDIPNVTDDTQWENLSTGAWSHNNNDSQYDTIYGKLYNWYAVNTNKLCPTDWHVPTDSEWTVLTDYLAANGHSGREGAALKATSGWEDFGSGNGTDNYGWNGLPGGFRFSMSIFHDIGDTGKWWSSSEYDSGAAWNRELTGYNSSNGGVLKTNHFIGFGFSVRCLRD